MKLSVATNFDSALIEAIKDYPVHELYGKLQTDFIGGGRSSYILSKVTKKHLRDHVRLARKNGIGFNYLLNAACLDNREITRRGQKEIYQLLDWVSQQEVSAVTVANPLLLRIIRKHFPHLKVRISVFAGVDHLRKAKYWEENGADIICLDSLGVNREFKTLKSILAGLSCKVELLTNNSCLQSCPLSQTHMNLLAHSSQSAHQSKGFVIDHCLLECSKQKLAQPVNFIRADWIRPEDIALYESIGIENFKIVERNLPTWVMVQRVRAYSERRYEGNLLDLIQPYGQKGSQKQEEKPWRRFLFLFRPSKVNVFKLKLLKDFAQKRGMLNPLENPAVVIDNRSLDGFLNRFVSNGCRNVDCEKCRYCHDVADKVVKINPEFQKECLDIHQEIDHRLENQGFW